ncbi:MAG: hypothetical protein FJZ86_18440 [Chloroflexi bacterium]|nr:hypothetical protein [Chloroflexota bacterium]
MTADITHTSQTTTEDIPSPMSKYYKNQPLGQVYVVSARPLGFWRRLMEWLPYNVGQTVQVEVTVESKRERGIAWMDCAYFEFVETMPNGESHTFPVDEKRIELDKKNKSKATIYPLDDYPTWRQPVRDEGKVTWKIVGKIFHEEAPLLDSKVVFLQSGPNVVRYFTSTVSFVAGIVSGVVITLIAQGFLGGSP